MWKKILTTLVACNLLLVAFSPSPSSALTVSPAQVNLDLAPGSSKQHTILLTNIEEQAQTYYVSVQTFRAYGEDGGQVFDAAKDQPVTTWLVPEYQKVIVRPHENLPMDVTINIPSNATPGGYYAVVFFSSEPPGILGSSVRTGINIGVLFLIQVEGSVHRALRLVSFETYPQKTVFVDLHVTFVTRLQNDGNVHEWPQGRIDIKNALGRHTASLDLNPSKRAVLPASIRRFESSWSDWAFGRYTAEPRWMNERGQESTGPAYTFWVIPWVSLVFSGVLLVILGSLAFIRYTRRIN